MDGRTFLLIHTKCKRLNESAYNLITEIGYSLEVGFFLSQKYLLFPWDKFVFVFYRPRDQLGKKDRREKKTERQKSRSYYVEI